MFWADWIITGTVIVCLLGLGVAMWSLWGTRPDSNHPTPCPKCGQTDQGQTGEYPCEACGLSWVWDDPSTSSGRGSESAPDSERDSEATPKDRKEE